MPSSAASIASKALVIFALGGISLARGGESNAPSGDTSSAISPTPGTLESTTTPTGPAVPTETPVLASSVHVGPNVGNRAPDFTLTFANGQTLSLTSLRDQGRPVVLYFLATW